MTFWQFASFSGVYLKRERHKQLLLHVNLERALTPFLNNLEFVFDAYLRACRPPWASLSVLNVKVHDSTNGRTLNKDSLIGRDARKKLLLFTELCLVEPQDFWNNVLWTHETKVGLFGYKWKINESRFWNVLVKVQHSTHLNAKSWCPKDSVRYFMTTS